MRYLSLFSGLGGFELGIQQAYEDKCKNVPKRSMGNVPICVGYSEIDRYAIQIYERHFQHKNYGDITTINASELPDFDLLVGGFPCQSFSIAGKRRGFEDTRGTLFFDICRIAESKKPVLMLLENVKGLISHDGGKTLEIILASLQELGYYVNYEIRNSKDYGVPQNRERIFFLCKHIKLLSSVGQNEKITTSESIIQEWLFTLLLNNLAEVKKLQEHASKDWVVGWLLLSAISQNQEWNGENISDTTLTPMVGGLFQSTENPWLNIDTWLSKNLGVPLQELSKSTISTAIRQITESKTYTYSLMLKSILLATVLLRKSSSHLWNEVLSSLIIIQEDTKYARINNKNEKAIITESGTAHLSAELQDPTRYFTLSHLRGTSRPKVFPFGGESPTTDTTKKLREPISNCLRTNYSNGKSNETYIRQINQPKHSNNRVYSEKGLSPTLNTMQGGLRQPFVAPVLTPDRPTKRQNGRRFKENGEPSFTLTAQDKHGITDGMKIRRLTPTECMQLQGFPDNWCDGISDSQKYKCAGNAVTVNVIQAIIEKL